MISISGTPIFTGTLVLPPQLRNMKKLNSSKLKLGREILVRRTEFLRYWGRGWDGVNILYFSKRISMNVLCPSTYGCVTKVSKTNL